jgi:hypothetical protein
MDKFQIPPRIDDTKGPSFYTTGILNTIPGEEFPFYYTAVEGDRFDVLANRFYKDSKYWWVIAKANNLANGSMSVPVATRLFIPNI